jgi:hypothetical protein
MEYVYVSADREDLAFDGESSPLFVREKTTSVYQIGKDQLISTGRFPAKAQAKDRWTRTPDLSFSTVLVLLLKRVPSSRSHFPIITHES